MIFLNLFNLLGICMGIDPAKAGYSDVRPSPPILRLKKTYDSFAYYKKCRNVASELVSDDLSINEKLIWLYLKF
jgi:hypothetical protein